MRSISPIAGLIGESLERVTEKYLESEGIHCTATPHTIVKQKLLSEGVHLDTDPSELPLRTPDFLLLKPNLNFQLLLSSSYNTEGAMGTCTTQENGVNH